MKACVFYGLHDIRCEERPTPKPSAGEVLIKIEACGVCGTDHHIFHGEFDTVPPVVPGHEYAGIVVEVGVGVTDIVPGDRVAVDPNMPCGICRSCQRGRINMCENLRALGVDVDGGFAEYCVAPRKQCYVLPEGVSTFAGAMTEPLACCVRGIQQAGIVPGDRVAVIGGGAIGQMLAQLARFAGAAPVVVSDPMAERRQMALELGADAVIDPLNENPLAVGGTLQGGADVVLEAVGSRVTTSQAVAWAAPGATIVWFGVTPPGHTIEIEPNEVFRKELTIRGARINPFTHARALALLAEGRIQVEPLMTNHISLEELPELLKSGPGGHIKTVVVP